MLPSNDRLYFLFEHYLNSHISDNELKELFDYIREAGENNLLREEIISVFKKVQSPEKNDEVNWGAMYQQIVGESALTEKKNINKLNLWKRVAAAVLILIIGGAGSYFFIRKNSVSKQMMQAAQITHDILPGGNKATLTLSNGKTIILNKANNGMLASAGNMKVIKVNNGMLAYQQEEAGTNQRSKIKDQRLEMNTLAVPRGGQYQLTLSDGTKVWLNAASSIRYPVAFTGKERVVEVTGEAYFEVAKNAAQPFIVKRGNMTVQVLGTHFNVNAYDDEGIVKVTLLEGLIKVQLENSSRQSAIVHPGEQAQMNKAGAIRLVKDADVNDAVSWKNGFFSFRNDNLEEVLRKLSRWYDVDVVYDLGVNNQQQFSGRIDRDLTLSQVLKGLALTQAHFKIEANRKLEILP
ncbi:MAG: DUF4974 domain-containing protein [Chitinophagaceae bacterium]|nr:MAG: DUF4974 domain-containing protein [Chitinophagaceae bacterium]